MCIIYLLKVQISYVYLTSFFFDTIEFWIILFHMSDKFLIHMSPLKNENLN